MDRLPLRLLAFVLGPVMTRRAAEAGRSKGAISGAPAARALRTPGGASLRTPPEGGAAQRTGDASDTPPPWLVATVGLAALIATGVAATSDGGRGGAHPHKHAPAAARDASHAADIGRDVGGV
jgi:hypothetical protein